MTCASNFAKSVLIRRRNTFLFALISLSHADNVAKITALGVTNDNHSAIEITEANNALLTVILSLIFELGERAREHFDGSLKIECSFSDVLESLRRII